MKFLIVLLAFFLALAGCRKDASVLPDPDPTDTIPGRIPGDTPMTSCRIASIQNSNNTVDTLIYDNKDRLIVYRSGSFVVNYVYSSNAYVATSLNLLDSSFIRRASVRLSPGGDPISARIDYREDLQDFRVDSLIYEDGHVVFQIGGRNGASNDSVFYSWQNNNLVEARYHYAGQDVHITHYEYYDLPGGEGDRFWQLSLFGEGYGIRSKNLVKYFETDGAGASLIYGFDSAGIITDMSLQFGSGILYLYNYARICK